MVNKNLCTYIEGGDFNKSTSALTFRENKKTLLLDSKKRINNRISF